MFCFSNEGPWGIWPLFCEHMHMNNTIEIGKKQFSRISSHDLCLENKTYYLKGSTSIKWNSLRKKIFYLPVNKDMPNFRCFPILVVVGTAASFGFPKRSPNETPFDSRPKTMNGQGYSEFEEPCKTRENCNWLIWLLNTTQVSALSIDNKHLQTAKHPLPYLAASFNISFW